MTKIAQKVEINSILDTIENNSTNDWEDLCTKCSSIINDAKMTEKDIDRIMKRCKKE